MASEFPRAVGAHAVVDVVPSGHSASATAFAVAVGDVLPELQLPLRAAASVVAFSRVYNKRALRGDVLVGASVGALIGRLTSRVARRVG
jgi:membrane-associated phospholipid phosphatase